jgi:hypothetical protein
MQSSLSFEFSVVYLAYTPYGLHHLEEFIHSYKRYDSGINHKLIILFNGHKNDSELFSFLDFLNASQVNFEVKKTSERLDITSYFDVAKYMDTEFVLFFNTYSIIQDNQWLRKYAIQFNDNAIGVVGATGCYGDFGHYEDYNKSISRVKKANFALADLKKILYFCYNFYPKVKPHIRTNAFMIRREVFLSLKCNVMRPFFLAFIHARLKNSKLGSLCFEHGNNSMTAQILAKGLKPILVGRDGRAYEIENWENANTFWINEQDNLLVSDNQTRKFTDAEINARRQMTFNAWGRI